MKPNAFVKLSGDVKQNPALAGHLLEITRVFSTEGIVGGGTDITKALLMAGLIQGQDWEFFGEMGRAIYSLEGRRIAEKCIRDNQTMVQDAMDELRIPIRVQVPVGYLGAVLWHRNGDWEAFQALLSFDKVFVFTEKDRVAKKWEFFRKLAALCGAEKILDRLEIIGF